MTLPNDRALGTSFAGFSLVEVMLVVVIIGAMVAIAVPKTSQWIENQRVHADAQDAEAALSYARGEAVRTGRLHLVFFNQDASGNALEFPVGTVVDMLVIDDGRPGDVTQNCKVDAGEAAVGYALEDGVAFGVTAASGTAPADGGGGVMSTGSSFTDAGGNQASWVMFRPEGVPLSFSSDCSTGAIGSGAGALYLTNGRRDHSVVVSPLGLTRGHGWNAVSGAWSS